MVRARGASGIVLLVLVAAEASAATKGWKIRRSGADLSGSVRAVQSADIDGDGLMDLVALHQDSGKRLLTVLWGDGEGSLSASDAVPVPPEAAYCDLGDLTAEPGEEIAFLTPAGVITLIEEGRKFGATKKLVDVPSLILGAQEEQILFARFAEDFDGDGATELLVQDFRAVRLLERAADGTFSVAAELPVPVHTKAASVLRDADRLSPETPRVTYTSPLIQNLDFDGDGRLDLAFLCRDRLWVYFQSADGFHAEDRLERDFEVAGKSAEDGERVWTSRLQDLDGDKMTDVIMGVDHWAGAGKKGSDLWIFRARRGTGTGRVQFPEKADQKLDAGDSMVSSLRLQDLSGDGKPDLVMVSFKVGLMAVIKILMSRSMTLHAGIYNQKDNGDFEKKPRQGAKLGIKLRLAAGSGTPLIEYADFDGDGRQDLCYGTDSNELSYFAGRTKGVTDKPMAVAKVSPYASTFAASLGGGPGTDLVLYYPNVQELGSRIEVLMDSGVPARLAKAAAAD